jgi:predicted protein tyrosine phosphatase
MLTKRVLFVCTGNYDRSPTAEELFRRVEGLEVDSAGTSPCASTPLSKPVSKRLLEWADIVFAMEDSHKQELLKIDASAEHKIVVLHIPDIYLRNQLELKRLLLERLAPYFKVRNYRPDETPEQYMTFFRKLFKNQLSNNF